MRKAVVVRRTPGRKTYEIVVSGEVREGGFFSKSAAEETAEREYGAEPTLTLADFVRFAPRVLGRPAPEAAAEALDRWTADGYGKTDEATIAAYLRRASA